MTPAPAAGRLLAGVVAAAGLLVLGAGPASAAHADVVATADCDGTVAYAITAWAGRPSTPERPALNERSRTNPDLHLQLSLDGRRPRPAVPDLALNQENNFSVTGTFSLPEDARPERLVLRTVPRAPWADGDAGVPDRSPKVDLTRCSDELDRRPLWLGGGVVGALAAWFLTRPRRRPT
jgi:hypothetical protein